MENSYDLNLTRCNFIKHSKRKPPNNCASESSVDNVIQVRIANDLRQCVVDPFHELDVQICALVSVPLTGLGKFGIRVRSEPNDHVRLTRLHELSFDLFPCAALPGIGPRRLQPSVEFSLLSIC